MASKIYLPTPIEPEIPPGVQPSTNEFDPEGEMAALGEMPKFINFGHDKGLKLVNWQ